jgi:hypothetical protein
VRTEDLGQRGELGCVAGGGARPVRLQQAQRVRRGRIEAGILPRPADGEGLAAAVRIEHAGGPAVAGRARAADDRVDAIAVAFGVGKAFQHDHAGALADQQAVRGRVERPDRPALGERAQLAEHRPEGDVVHMVDATGEDRVQAARGELGDALVHREQ